MDYGNYDFIYIDHAFKFAMWTNLASFLLHYANKRMEIWSNESQNHQGNTIFQNRSQFAFLGKYFIIIKVVLQFMAAALGQVAITVMFDQELLNKEYKFIKGTESVKHTLLLFYVLYFYYTIISQILFLFLSRVYPFQTLKERSGFGGN